MILEHHVNNSHGHHDITHMMAIMVNSQIHDQPAICMMGVMSTIIITMITTVMDTMINHQ